VAPNYVTENTFEVLFRLNGSVWLNVLPWCLANTALAAAIHYYGDEYAHKFITASDKGHMFMSLSVSYLLVTRTNICLNRYMAQRSGLSDVVRSCKELVGHAVTYTRMKHKTEDDKRWRRSIAKRTISLLKTIVAVMKYPSSKKHVWDMDDIGEEDKLAAKIAVGKSNERSPLVLVLFLRSVICSHIHKLSQPLEVQHELQLMQNTTDIMSAYSEVMKYLTTPYPFPLVQMTRTILFVYIFTLPLALSSDIQEVVPFLLTIFFITYGFIGLELIAIEIDDPFGTDPNDFNVGNIAKTVYDDIILFITDVDGVEAATEIKKTVKKKVAEVIESTVKNHGQFSRVEAWFKKRGSSKSVLSIDTFAEKVTGVADYEYDSDMSLGPDSKEGTPHKSLRPPTTHLVRKKSLRKSFAKNRVRTSSLAGVSKILEDAEVMDEEDEGFRTIYSSDTYSDSQSVEKGQQAPRGQAFPPVPVPQSKETDVEDDDLSESDA